MVSHLRIIYSSWMYFTHLLMLSFGVGERHATINMHYLLHLVDSVRDLGPLWANTCFEFESSNSAIKKLLHGTQKFDMQVH